MVKQAVEAVLPGWLPKLVVGAMLAAVLGWAGQWAAHVEGAVAANASTDARQQTMIEEQDKRVADIRGALDRIEGKIDKINERELARKGR